MLAMLLEQQGGLVEPRDLPVPEPASNQIRIKVAACGVCRTDLHVVDGDLDRPALPLIPGHEVVGYVDKLGDGVEGFKLGDRIGLPWLGWTCGKCRYCLSDRENLCDNAGFNGYTLNGGYAEFAVADSRYCFHIADGMSDAEAAPLLCAGLIGYRSLRFAGDARKIGLYGFGASAHIVCQIAVYQKRQVYAFTRPSDVEAQNFAKQLGAVWAGGSEQIPPEELDAAIIFAPVGSLVPTALRAICKGGCVVCAGIHMSDIPRFPYEILWGEREIVSVANLTRQDGIELLDLAPRIPVKTHITTYPLIQANEALCAVREGKITGAVVLIPPSAA